MLLLLSLSGYTLTRQAREIPLPPCPPGGSLAPALMSAHAPFQRHQSISHSSPTLLLPFLLCLFSSNPWVHLLHTLGTSNLLRCCVLAHILHAWCPRTWDGTIHRIPDTAPNTPACSPACGTHNTAFVVGHFGSGCAGFRYVPASAVAFLQLRCHG